MLIKRKRLLNTSVFSIKLFASWPYKLLNKDLIEKKKDQSNLDLMVCLFYNF